MPGGSHSRDGLRFGCLEPGDPTGGPASSQAAQFVSIGYLHKKIQPPYNIIAIPVGTIMTLIVHPTIVGYIM